ncbi:MAG: hypothetical protein JEY99_21750 [Spirochaetales bacterium]|nr:hypothetical protein [Spirochaetales bacterium]
MWIEIFGTAMSAIIAISLMQKNIKWLRIINAVGAVGIAVYGFFIGSWPVVILNMFIFIIDIYYLFQLRNRDEVLDYIEIDGLKSIYVGKFLDFHLEDIHNFMPEFDRNDKDGVKGCLILRDIIPVALILYRNTEPEVGEILLDYSVPSHRDYANSRYFFKYVMAHLDLGGVKRMTAKGSTKLHCNYLENMGFNRVKKEGKVNFYNIELEL